MDFCWETMYKAEEAEFVPMLQPEMEGASDFVITCYCVASWRTQNYWRNTQIINKMYFFYKRKWKMFTSTTKYIIYNTVNKISTNVIQCWKSSLNGIHAVWNHSSEKKETIKIIKSFILKYKCTMYWYCRWLGYGIPWHIGI